MSGWARVQRAKMLVGVVGCVALLGAPGCGDDGTTEGTTDAMATDVTAPTDVVAPTDTPAPQDVPAPLDAGDTAEPDVSEPDVPEPDVDTCENPCLDDNGKPKKKLCPEPQSDWNCTLEGCCVPVFKCASDDDCEAQGIAEGQCEDARFACRCDVPSGECFEWYCGTNGDCEGGQICAAGACVDAPMGGLDIRIVTRGAILTPGAAVQLLAEAFDPANPNVVVAAEVTWSSDTTDAVAIDGDGLATGGAVGGNATITATLVADAAKTATVGLRNVLPGAEATLTVIVADQAKLTPVAGRYAFVDGASGATLATGELDAAGVATLTDPIGLGGVDVHVFAEGHDWVSWLGHEGGVLLLPVAQTTYADIVLDGDSLYDAAASTLIGASIIRGTPDMSIYPRAGELEVSLSSFALSDALYDFNLAAILGADVTRFFDPDTNIPGVDITEEAQMPGGLTFGLAGPALPDYYLGAPGGTRTLWTMGGRVDVNDIAEYVGEIFEAIDGSDSIDFNRLINAIFPLFRFFWSGVTPDIAVAGDGDPTFQTVNPQLSTPMSLKTEFLVPMLPDIAPPGHTDGPLYADAVLLLGGALLPTAEFLPLGINGGSDTPDASLYPPDGIADRDVKTPEQDPYEVITAPLHSGIGGPHTRYATAIVAASFRIDSKDTRPDGGSIILTRSEPGSGPAVPDAGASFLAFPDNRGWDAETRVVALDAVEGSDTQRVLFKGKRGDNWNIWLGGRSSYTVPVPKTLLELGDEVEFGDRSTGSLAFVLLNCFDFTPDQSAASIGTPGGITLDRMLMAVDRVSFVDVR